MLVQRKGNGMTFFELMKGRIQMKKKLLMVLISVSMIASVFTGCGNSTEAKDSGKAQTEQAATESI